jgi:hypothetical protein
MGPPNLIDSFQVGDHGGGNLHFRYRRVDAHGLERFQKILPRRRKERFRRLTLSLVSFTYIMGSIASLLPNRYYATETIFQARQSQTAKVFFDQHSSIPKFSRKICFDRFGNGSRPRRQAGLGRAGPLLFAAALRRPDQRGQLNPAQRESPQLVIFSRKPFRPLPISRFSNPGRKSNRAQAPAAAR